MGPRPMAFVSTVEITYCIYLVAHVCVCRVLLLWLSVRVYVCACMRVHVCMLLLVEIPGICV